MRASRRLASRPGRPDRQAGGDTGRRRLRRVGFAGLALLLAFGLPSAALADSAEGEGLYEQFCQACHQPGAVGIPGTFPPLAGNPALDDPDYFRSVMANGLEGELVVDGVTYNGQMPAFPQLSAADVDSLLAYLVSLKAPGAGSPTTSAPPPQSGDPAAGELLFIGSERLTNLGGSCFGCHSAGGYRGARLGPDLTDAYDRLGGEVGLAAWMAAPPSPTMQPIFTERPLTEGEVADLVAFLATTPGSATAGTDWMLLGGLGGLAGLFALMAFVFKRPRTTYVDRLRSRA